MSSDQLWEWDIYDRMAVTVEMMDKFKPLFLQVIQITEKDAKSVWPQPNPPDWDYDNNRPYPFHLLHFKFRQWISGACPFSPCYKHDIMYFLAHLDDGHKQIFYSWMYFHRLVNNDRSTIDRSMDYEYRLSSGSELFRAHSFLHFITNMMTVNQQRKYEIESVLTPIGVVKSRFSQDWMALVVDYDSPCSVSFYYECSTPESQNNCIDDYNRQLHPKNNDNDRTLATRPTLTTAQKKKQLNERSNLAFLESLMRSD